MGLKQPQNVLPPVPGCKLEHDPGGATRGGTRAPNAHDGGVQMGEAKIAV